MKLIPLAISQIIAKGDVRMDELIKGRSNDLKVLSKVHVGDEYDIYTIPQKLFMTENMESSCSFYCITLSD